MNRNELIETAKKLFYYEKVSIEGFNKEALMAGLNKKAGRFFAPRINESEMFPWRISAEKLVSFAEKIIDQTKDAESIMASMNQQTVNKEEIARQFAEVVSQGGSHALPLFIEHFFPTMVQTTRSMLMLNGFSEKDADAVMEEIESYQFEITLMQTPEYPMYRLEAIPVLKGLNPDDIFGCRITASVPFTFPIPGTEDFSQPVQNFLRMKMIGFAERLSELPLSSEENHEQSVANDRQVINEWGSSRELWYIHSEQWVLNFLSHFAVAYITKAGIRSMKSQTAIMDQTFDKRGTTAHIMN